MSSYLHPCSQSGSMSTREGVFYGEMPCRNLKIVVLVFCKVFFFIATFNP